MEKNTLHLSSGDVVTFMVDGRLDNLSVPAYQEFYPDGTPKRFICYIEGKVSDLESISAIQEFYPDGSIKSRNSYTKDVPNLCLDFHDGQVYSRYEFENGILIDAVEKSKKTLKVKKTWETIPGGFKETNSLGYLAYFDSEMRLHRASDQDGYTHPCLIWSSDLLGVGNAEFKHGRMKVWNAENSIYTNVEEVYQRYLKYTPEYTYGDQTCMLNIFAKLAQV
jgi:hypothetical protein